MNMISVIIPMYNSKNTIKSAIESVLNQTYKKPIEIIVINDGSKDACEKIVEDMILDNKTNRTIRLINKPNGGVSSARNRGIKEARANWLAFLDSDDIWLPEKLQEQINEIKKDSNIKFLGTNRNGEFYPFFKKSEQKIYQLNAKEIIAKWYPHTSTALIKKELFKTNLYDETRTHAEDGDLLLKFAQYSNLYVMNKNLVYTGGDKRSFGESGLSANMPKMYEGEISALKGAKIRKQINFLEYLAFYCWLTLKYYRRIFIVKGSK